MNRQVLDRWRNTLVCVERGAVCTNLQKLDASALARRPSPHGWELGAP